MDFEDTPEEATFRSEARAWLEAHAELKRDDRVLSMSLTDAHSAAEDEHVRSAKAWQRTLFDGGWAALTWPKEYGGRSATPIQQIIFNQEQARFEVPSGIFVQGIGMAGPTLIRHGADEQKQRYLEPMLKGEEVWCQLFSEPGAGSDLAGLSTRAVRDGDEYLVNGQKVWSSGAHYSDLGILLARTDPSVPKHRGITYFVVDMRSPGIEIRPLRQITGTAHFNEVFFSDVRIPAENVVGDVNRGWGVAMTTLTVERTAIGGLGADIYPDLEHLARRFGRTGDPVVRQGLAAAYIRLQVMKYLGWRVMTALSRGEARGPESSVMKLAYSRHQEALGNLCLAIEGATGMLADTGDPQTAAWGMRFLSQWSSRIGGGTDEVQRNVLGERVLGLPGEPRVDREAPFQDLVKQ
jgi:alkylation response protein AidB-like acyl-CoA dehydrogenase